MIGAKKGGDKKKPCCDMQQGLVNLSWQRPTLPPKGSTISAKGLNFSVRNGKR